MKKRQVLNSLAGLIVIACIAGCGAKPPTKEEVTGSIKKIMPLNFEVVQVTPLKQVPGLNEVVVVVDKQPVVFYMDDKAKYVVSGSMIAVETKQNLTQETQMKFKSAQPATPVAPVTPPAK